MERLKHAICPDGSSDFPARTCCDIKRCYPDTESGKLEFQLCIDFFLLCITTCIFVGVYYIDPNGGSAEDKFEAQCAFTEIGCRTCIDPDSVSLYYFTFVRLHLAMIPASFYPLFY